MLKKDLISSPGLWDLVLEVHEGSVTVTATPLVGEQEALCREVPMNRVLSSRLAAIEELIYDNPLLLADFHAVEVLVDTRRMLFLPTAWASEDAAQRAVQTLWPDGGWTTLHQDIAAVGETLVMAVDEGIASFMHRTYPDALLRHPMEVMIERVAKELKPTDPASLAVDLCGKELRIVGIAPPVAAVSSHEPPRQRLAIANVYDADNAEDAVYYILAAAKATGVDIQQRPIVMTGTSPLRADIIARLSDFALVTER